MTNPYHNDKRLLELLERWQTGDFTRADEQELQALTTSDDFRREAAEGFMSEPEADHSLRLDTLRSRLRNRAHTARRVMLPQWLAAVAAVALLILAVVWLVPVSYHKSVSEESVAAPSVLTYEEQPQQNEAAQDLAAAPIPERKETSSPERTGVISPETVKSDPDEDLAMMATDTEGGMAIQDVPPVAVPIAGAPAEEGASKSTDLAADFGEQEEARTQAPGKGMAKKKEARSLPAEDSAGAQPLGGWTAFNEYLRKNARLPEQARQNNLSGVVRIRFEVDTQGKPGAFKILKPLGYGCDEAARKLIEQYSWQPGQHNELTVDIPFVR